MFRILGTQVPLGFEVEHSYWVQDRTPTGDKIAVWPYFFWTEQIMSQFERGTPRTSKSSIFFKVDPGDFDHCTVHIDY